MSEEDTKTTNVGRIIRTIAIIAVVVLLFVIIIANSSTRRAPGDEAWDEATTIGNHDAKNYYIMYTDLMCPYCDVFSRAVMEHWDEFQDYLAENDILFEIRLTDYLYAGSGSEYSRAAAEATYCATRENKFWEFYHGAIASLWEDYHSKGIGSSKTATPIRNMPDNYWLEIGHEAGLGEQFDQCVANHETVNELDRNTARALQVAQGMPYFQFNDFTMPGFDSSWGWDYVLRYLDAGLGKVEVD